MVKAFNRSDVTYEYLVAWAYFHELGHTEFSKIELKECTGVLLELDDGSIVHGRNMD